MVVVVMDMVVMDMVDMVDMMDMVVFHVHVHEHVPCSMCSKNMLLFHGLSHYMDDAAGGDNTPSFPWTFSLHR